MATLHTEIGYIYDGTAHELLPKSSNVHIVKGIQLYNPTTADISGVLVYLLKRDDHEDIERTINRFAFTLPASGTWSFGIMNGTFYVSPGWELMCILPSAPTTPIEFTVDYANP